MDLSKIHILEIGDHHHFKETFYERTTLLWTGRKRPRVAPRDYIDCTPRAFVRAIGDVAAGKFDIVIAYAGQRSPWHPRHWLRAIFSRGLSLKGPICVFGVNWLRYPRIRAPLVVLDLHDIPSIHSTNFFLLDSANMYFKRELPVDYWQAFLGTAHANLPTLRVRRNPMWQRRIEKLQPISLPAGSVDLDRSDADIFSGKINDVFFAGS